MDGTVLEVSRDSCILQLYNFDMIFLHDNIYFSELIKPKLKLSLQYTMSARSWEKLLRSVIPKFHRTASPRQPNLSESDQTLDPKICALFLVSK